MLTKYSAAVLMLMCLNVGADEQQIQFIDVTSEAGIQFRHANGAKGNYHLPEQLGAGGAFLDYDTDGDLDLYLVNSGDLPGESSSESYTSVLYRNNGNGTFTNVTSGAGVGNTGNYGIGAACGDYDNDGDPDLYVTNFGPNVLYRNNGDGTFTNVTQTSGVGDPLWGSSATFLDYDRDGNLDLYIVNYLRYHLDVPHAPCEVDGIRILCHPKNYDGAPDKLFRNNGDGTFTNVSEAAGFKTVESPHSGKGLGVVAADFDNNGDVDIYVANDDTPNYLYYNNGDGTFTEMGLLAGCAYSFNGVAQAGMGVDAGDYNGDGFLDIFVTNLSYETNALYKNNGDGTFSDVIYAAHLGDESFLFVGFGTRFFDFDNDGNLDIFIANGHIIDNIAQVTDILTYAQRNQLFHNNGNGTFSEVSFNSGTYFQHESVSRGAIFGDFDNDGDCDIVTTQVNQPPQLLRNEGGNHQNWLRVKLVGVISNRDGIGARLTLTSGSRSWVQEVRAGSSIMCSNDPRCLFGLSDYAAIDRLEVLWPSGIVQVIENLLPNQEIVIKESNGG